MGGDFGKFVRTLVEGTKTKGVVTRSVWLALLDERGLHVYDRRHFRRVRLPEFEDRHHCASPNAAAASASGASSGRIRGSRDRTMAEGTSAAASVPA